MAEAGGAAKVNLFVLLYALAWAGGSIAYTPLLTILLPVQVAKLAGASAAVEWLAGITLTGAVAASLGGIAFGYASDLSGNRKVWIAAGLILSIAMLTVIGSRGSRLELTVAVVCWQLALNMMLGPLAALAGDVVPDDHKGLLGGLMAFAPAFGAASGALVTAPWLDGFETCLWMVGLLVALCVLPVLLVTLPPRVVPPEPRGAASAHRRHLAEGNLARMWFARLAVQIAEACLFSYLYYWMLTLDPAISDNQTARLFGFAMFAAAPLALFAGRWSDRTNRPIAPLQACAVIAALGLLTMSLAHAIALAVVGYLIFGLSSAAFLALHSAQTLRVLPRADRRARDLGLFNLANTVPSLVMPWLAMGLVPSHGYPALFILLAVLCSGAFLLLRSIARQVRTST